MADYQPTPTSWNPPGRDDTLRMPAGGPPPMSSKLRPLSPLAVVGLILAFLLAPLGLALSLVALGRTGHGRDRGRSLAVGGVVVGGVLTLGILLGIAGSIAEQSQQTGPGAGTPPLTSAATAAASQQAPPITPEASPAAAAPAPAEPAPGSPSGVGTTVVDGEFSFTVTNARRIGDRVENSIFEQSAQGEFYLVTVTVTNTGDIPRDLAHGYQNLYDDQGREYQATDAWLALPNADRSVFATINPGNTVVDAPLLFDIPAGVTVDRIELHDMWYSDGTSVALS